MKPSLFLVGAALAAAVGGCGKTEDKPGTSGAAPSTSPAAPAAAGAAPAAAASGKELGRCKVDVTGDVTASAESVRRAVTDTKVSFGTDYWMSDDELKTAMRVMAGIGSDKTDAEKDAAVAKGMSNDPRLFVFIMNCGDDNVSVSLMPGNNSRYADIPRAPKKYVVTSGAKAGEFNAMVSVGDGHFTVKGPGTLEVTRFDSSRLEGTFAFDAEERYDSKRNVKVAGSFAFDCVGSKSCGK